MRILRPISRSIFCACFCSMPQIPWRAFRTAGPSSACSSTSKIFAQLRGRCLRLALEAERRHEVAVLVHEVDNRGVIHGVVAAVERHFLVKDAISLGDVASAAASPVSARTCGSKLDR